MAGVVLKFVPLMVTVVPIGPDAGEKELMVGDAAMKLNPAKEPVPLALVTDTLPDAPFPTTAVMAEELITV